MQDVMLDIETTGLSFDKTAIIQIAAVKFNWQTQEVDADDMFDRCMFIPKTRYWDEGTRDWWLADKRDILSDIFVRMEQPAKVLRDFSDWVNPQAGRRLWTKRQFDYPFLSSYFTEFSTVAANPFAYYNVIELTSFIRGLYTPEPVPDLGIEFEGPAHHALYDVLHQIKLLFAHIEDAQK